METFGSFAMNQIFKMEWLDVLIAMLLSNAGIDVATQWGASLHFFIYDTIKIVILLCVMIFIISYVQSFSRQNEASIFWEDSMASLATL